MSEKCPTCGCECPSRQRLTKALRDLLQLWDDAVPIEPPMVVAARAALKEKDDWHYEGDDITEPPLRVGE